MNTGVTLKNTFVHVNVTPVKPRLVRSKSLQDLEEICDPFNSYESTPTIYTPTKTRHEYDESPPRNVPPRVRRNSVRRNSQPALLSYPPPILASPPAGVRLGRRGSAPSIGAKQGVLGAAPPGFLPAILSSPIGGYSVPPIDGIPTTAMLRNIPARVTPLQLQELLDARGFHGLYDFLYLPVDFDTHYSLGYAFINFSAIENLQRFTLLFHGSAIPLIPARKFCEVCMAKVQGLEANLRLFAISTTVGELPHDLKPIVLLSGRYVHFPDSSGSLPTAFD